MERLRNLIIPVDGKLGTINRRNLFKGLGGAVTAAVIPIKIVTPVEMTIIPSELITPPELPPKKLDDYLKEIQPEQELWQRIIEEKDLFGDDFKRLSWEEALSDFNLYFPMYKAGEIKYGVDFVMLWVTHIQETTSSKDTNKSQFPIKGCMQRHSFFYKDYEPPQAGIDWEFLSLLPTKGGSDWMEILWATSKMEEDRRRILNEKPDLLFDPKNLMHKIFYKYCKSNTISAQRVSQCFKMKDIKEEFSNPS